MIEENDQTFMPIDHPDILHVYSPRRSDWLAEGDWRYGRLFLRSVGRFQASKPNNDKNILPGVSIHSHKRKRTNGYKETYRRTITSKEMAFM